MNFSPSYIKLYEQGKLQERAKELMDRLKDCHLCPRACGVNRLKGELGYCKTGRHAIVSSANPHFGEEPPLVGRHGSGTIFFTNCNLGCIYCQNYEISWLGEGREIDKEGLAELMLELQSIGCHNINFVTPTHVVAQIVEALVVAIEKGLHVPLVYNTGGYDSVDTLKLLKDIFDIYMPDTKYSESEPATKYSNAPNYWEINKACLLEMQKQVGDLRINEQGIAERGLLIRHLVLPYNLAGSFKVLKFIREHISKDAYVNIMDQYRPCFKAFDFPMLSRSITYDEYRKVIDYAKKLGLHRGFEEPRRWLIFR